VDVEARVQLPSYVRGEIEVFVNGVAQIEGRDFRREPTSLVFNRPIAKEGKLGTIRWLSMLLGIAGTYRPAAGRGTGLGVSPSPGIGARRRLPARRLEPVAARHTRP
jgi:hypothetical protein